MSSEELKFSRIRENTRRITDTLARGGPHHQRFGWCKLRDPGEPPRHVPCWALTYLTDRGFVRLIPTRAGSRPWPEWITALTRSPTTVDGEGRRRQRRHRHHRGDDQPDGRRRAIGHAGHTDAGGGHGPDDPDRALDGAGAELTGYNVQYRQGSGDWQTTGKTITGLTADTSLPGTGAGAERELDERLSDAVRTNAGAACGPGDGGGTHA